MSLQGLRQQSVRDVTGTAYDYNGDWHALFDLHSIPAGDFNGRLLTWLGGKLGATQTNLNDAMNAYAVAQGVDSWNSLGTFTPGGLFEPVTDLGAALAALWSADSHGTANMTDDGSGLISSWKDVVGGLDLAGATTARPTWSATSFNSAFAGVTGDGTANALTAAATTGLPTGTNESWIIALVNQPSDGSARFVFSYGAATASAGRKIQKISTDRLQVNNGTAGPTHSADAFVGIHLVAGHFVAGGASIEGYFDSVPTTPASAAASTNTSTTRTRMFSDVGAAASGFGTCTVRYIAVCGAVTALQLDQLEGWMCHTSGKSALLSAAHPFRNMRP